MKQFILLSILLVNFCRVFSQTIPFGLSKDTIYPDCIRAFRNPEVIYDVKRQSIHYYKPINYNSITSPLLFAIPGTGWDGDNPINDLKDIADRRGMLIVGIDLSNSIERGIATFRYYDTLNTLPTPYNGSCEEIGPASRILNELYQHTLQREGRTEIPSYMIGFSQGGQFVTRYMLIRQAYPDSIPLKMAVSVNPYYYTFPTDSLNGINMPWPCGLAPYEFVPGEVDFRCPESINFFNFGCHDRVKQYYNENYAVLIGTADTEPFNNNACGMAQGSNRYERAQNFYNFGLIDAPNYGTTLNWKYKEIPGVAHNQYQMYNNKNLPTDTLTIAERLLFETPYIPVQKTAPVAHFTMDTIVTCTVNNAINFINNSVNASSYLWDFGDGTFSTDVNPVHYFITTIDSTEIGVYDTICQPYPYDIDPITGDSIYLCVSTQDTIYYQGQYFSVQLKAMNDNGCANYDIKRNRVKILPNPTNVSIKENDNLILNVALHPNPANDEVTIEWGNSNHTSFFYLYSATGMLLNEEITNKMKIKINTKELPNGLYFIKVSNNNKIVTKKLIVMH